MNEVELMRWVEHVDGLMRKYDWDGHAGGVYVTWAMDPSDGTERDAEMAASELRRRWSEVGRIEVIRRPIFWTGECPLPADYTGYVKP